MIKRLPAKDLDKFIVRLPEGMRDEIKAAAEVNGRSANAEIVARLDASLRPHQDGVRPVWLPDHLWKRIEYDANLTEQDPNLLILEAVERAFPPRPDFRTRLQAIVREIQDSGGARSKDDALIMQALEALMGDQREQAPSTTKHRHPWEKTKSKE